MRSILSFFGISAALVVVAATGCDQSDSTISPAVLAAHQTRLVLAEEPDGVQTVLDVREALLGESIEIHDHDHAEHGHEEHADHDEEEHAEHPSHAVHAVHGEEEHAGHDHDGNDHPDEDHAGHDHDGDEHSSEEHAGHDHDDDEHAEEEHAGHDEDGDEHSVEEHAGHDHDDHADEEHAGHDEDDHAEDEHAEHEHEDEDAHEREAVAEIKPTGPIDVLMVGTIGGLTNPWEKTQPEYPFAENQASFFLADPGAVAEQEASGHVHTPGEECSFCAANAADSSAMLAVVRFLDENGKILPIGVPGMFDVKAMDTVVIQGTARIVAGGMLVVDATGIYVRR